MDKAELTEKWNEVCYFLHHSISSNISEELFEQKVFQVLEKMGWSSYRKEIQLKQSIQVGSNGKIVPDISVKSIEKKFQFVIEVKKPSVNIDDCSHERQLISYMRMLKNEYGLIIGSNIKIYYDGNISDSDDPILLTQFQFNESSEEGMKFIELFSKDTYSESQLKLFTEEILAKLQAKKDFNKILNLITSDEYIDNVKLLIECDLKDKFNDEIIINALNHITLKIIDSGQQDRDIQILRKTEEQSHQHQLFYSSSENNKPDVINSTKNSMIKRPINEEDNITRYSLSETSNNANKEHNIIEPHIFKSFGINIDEFANYLADKYIVDNQQKEIFLSEGVWLKVRLNYIGGLILKLEGKEIFSPKDIRAVLKSKVITSLSEISDKQFSGCLLTQDVCLDAPNPKWHNGFPCLERVAVGKYRFIGLRPKSYI